jgi:hypothetical protein
MLMVVNCFRATLAFLRDAQRESCDSVSVKYPLHGRVLIAQCVALGNLQAGCVSGLHGNVGEAEGCNCSSDMAWVSGSLEGP